MNSCFPSGKTALHAVSVSTSWVKESLLQEFGTQAEKSS